MKNKTLTTYLALFFGTLGAHRFYLKSLSDPWAWLHIAATAIGLYGVSRVFALGQDDQLSWVMVPFLGLSIAAAGLTGVVFGLMHQAQWNERYNPMQKAELPAGRTTGLTIFAVILCLLLGATALMSVIAFTGQRYFEYSLKKSAS